MLLTKNKDAAWWYTFHKISDCYFFLLDCIINAIAFPVVVLLGVGDMKHQYKKDPIIIPVHK